MKRPILFICFIPLLILFAVGCGGGGGSGPQSNNNLPTVLVLGNQTADEGEPVDFFGSVTDEDVDDTHTYRWDFGDGTSVTGTLSPSHSFPDNGLYTVTLTATDNNGGSGTDSLTVTVANVAPTAKAGDDQEVDEGQAVALLGDQDDPGTGDTHSYLWDFGDSSPASTSRNPIHVYADNNGGGLYTVTLTVTDDEGEADTDTLVVTVNNVPPSVGISLAGPAYRNQEASFAGSFTDPAGPADEPYVFLWDFGDGATSTSQNPTHTFTAFGDYRVTLTVTDKDSDFGAYASTVTVANRNPVADPRVNQGTIAEGSSASFTGSFSDPDVGDTHTFLWDFGDSSPTSTSRNPTHIFADNDADGLYTVTFTVTDSGSGQGTGTLTVTVNNIPPTANAGSAAPVDEGSPVSFAGVGNDVGSDTLSFRWKFGDGNSTEGTLSPIHTYEDNGSYTVELTVSDDDGAASSDTLTVTVNNVAPTAEALGDPTVAKDVAASFAASFTDPAGPADDPYTFLWDFGDGTATSTSQNPTHTYTTEGIFTVTLTVTDDDSDPSIADTLTVTVANELPVADPQADQTTIDEGSSVSFTGSFSDADAGDTHTFLWTFGDG
ncbi:MAG: PKD domain-containing protein, partial [bacterium]